jgi:hypothetical protein
VVFLVPCPAGADFACTGGLRVVDFFMLSTHRCRIRRSYQRKWRNVPCRDHSTESFRRESKARAFEMGEAFDQFDSRILSGGLSTGGHAPLCISFDCKKIGFTVSTRDHHDTEGLAIFSVELSD